MGAVFSGLVADCVGAPMESNPGLGDIPESCVAVILTNLDPLEICKLARLNRVFREASSADVVWESKLPENYQILMKKFFSECPQNLTKKEIYARLCRPNRFDGGTEEVWMEQSSGKICVSVSWKGMKITGIDDRRYWNHIPSDESRFCQIAFLQQIWWLEVDGNIEFHFPRGTYSLYFRLRLGNPTTSPGRQRVRDHGKVHGWNIKPVRFQFSTSNDQKAVSQCYLNERAGKWVNHHVGDFSVENSSEATKIKFSMMQIDCTHTKGGLCLDSVLILPK